MVAVVLALLAGARPAGAEGGVPRPILPAPEASGQALPGVVLAHQLTLATGLAISPLLGVSGVGLVHWLRTPAAERGRLPWTDSPWLWLPGLLLSALLVVKNLLPKGLKLPMDAAEFLGHKASALVLAAPVLVPLALQAVAPPATGTPAAAVPVAASSLLPPLGQVGAVVATVVVFFVVFVVGQAVNALILLSPSSLVDNALKAARGAVLGTLVLASLVHPVLGLAVALVIIAVSLMVFGWAWRLVVCGTVVAWDLLTLRHRRVELTEARVRAFVFRPVGRAPRLTYGWLEVTDVRALSFTWRAWPLLRRRRAELADVALGVERGLVLPTVLGATDGRRHTLFWLPPRYRGHEQRLADAGGLGAPLDSPVVRGFRAAWRWLRGLWRRAPAEAPAA